MNRAKQYLIEYTKMRKRVVRLQDKLDELNEQMDKITSWSDNERVQSSLDPDKIGALVAKKLDMQAEIVMIMDELMDKMEEVEFVLNQIENPDYALILQYRYIRGLTWNAIQDRMNFSKRWILILHGRALQEVDKLI